MKAAWDHLALGAWSHDEVAAEFTQTLGGRELARFKERSWSGLQLAFAAGIRLEILEPIDAPADDFLARFLEHSGPGPHHLTFKVDDIEAGLARMADLGIEPTKVDLSDPNWKEAFLHPRLGVGTVIQLAQAGGEWSAEKRLGELPAGARRAAFTGAVIRADLERAELVFGRLLGGDRTEVGAAVAYSWDGDATLLVRTAGAERPRIEHLVFRDQGGVDPGETLLLDGPATILRLAESDPWPG